MQLRTAGQTHRIAGILTYLGYFLLALGLPGLLLTSVILLILMPGAWVSGIALAFAIVPLLLWLLTRSRAKSSSQARDVALEQAYSQQILAELGTSAVELDAEHIARSMGLPLERTERMLTRLNADDRMTSRVTDEGSLVFGVTEPVRMRLAPTDDPFRNLDAVSPFPKAELGNTQRGNSAITDAELADSEAAESETSDTDDSEQKLRRRT